MQKYSPYRDTYRRHRKLFLGLPLAAMLIAIWFVAGAPKQYESTTALWFDNPPPQTSSITQGTDLTGITQPPAAQAQVVLNELLSTRDFRTQIGKSGPLQSYLAHHTSAGWGPTGLIAELKGTGSLSDRVVKALGPSAVTTRVVGPQVLAVAVHSTSPTVAAGTLKALIAEYRLESNTVQTAQSKASLQYYRAQKTGAQKELAAATTRFTNYVAAHPGAVPCTATQTAATSATCDVELKTLSDARKVASAQVTAATQQLNQASTSLASLPTGTAKILVIDPPRVPTAPIKGPKNIVLAAIAGLFAGFLVSLLGVIAITGAELRAAAEVRARRLDDEREAAARQAVAAPVHPRLAAAPEVEPFELVAFPPAPPAPPAPEVDTPAPRPAVEPRPVVAELPRPVVEKPAPPVEVPVQAEVEPEPEPVVEVPVQAEVEPEPEPVVEVPVQAEVEPEPEPVVEVPVQAEVEPELVEESPPPAEPTRPRAPRKRTPVRNHKVRAAEAAEAVAAVSDNGAVSDESVVDLRAHDFAPSHTEEVEQPTEVEVPAEAAAAVEEAPQPAVGERRRAPRTGARNRKTAAADAPVADAVEPSDVPAEATEPTPAVEDAPPAVVPERRPPRLRNRKTPASEAPVTPAKGPAPLEATFVVEETPPPIVEETPPVVVAETPSPVVEDVPTTVVPERRPPRVRKRKAPASEAPVTPAEVPAPLEATFVEEASPPVVEETPPVVVAETPSPVASERRRTPRSTSQTRKAPASEAPVPAEEIPAPLEATFVEETPPEVVEETPPLVVEETPPPVASERRRTPRSTSQTRKAPASEAPVPAEEIPAPSGATFVEETPPLVAEATPPAVPERRRTPRAPRTSRPVAKAPAAGSDNGATPSEPAAEEAALDEVPAAPVAAAPRLFAKLGKDGKFRGTVLEVRNDGVGRRRRPVWTVRQEADGAFVPPIGGLLHLAGDSGHDGTVIALNDGGEGLVIYEVEIPEVRPSRSKITEPAIPPLDPRWVGTDVTFGIGPSPSARRREERRAAEAKKGKSGEQRPSELPGKITSAS